MILIRLLIAAAVLFSSTPAFGQLRCSDRETTLKHLAKKYHERRVAVAVTSNGRLVEVLAAPDGETFTILLTQPNGTTCHVLSGEGWRLIEPESLDPKA